MTGPDTDLVDRVCWALARECRDDDVAIVGVATPLAAAAVLLARATVAPNMTAIIGGAVDPDIIDIAELATDPHAASRAAATTLGQMEMLPMLQRGVITLQFVSPAQVDRRGAVNTSRVRREDGSWRRLPGCLALPDTTVMAGRLIAYRIEGGERFVVDQVDYTTGIGASAARAHFDLPGRGVVAIVTEHGRRALGPEGPDDLVPHEPIPAEASELLRRRIDPHAVLGFESRSGRAAAARALREFSAGRR